MLATQKVPKHNILAHGLSIGGALACALADANPGVHLVLDQAFSNGRATALHVANTKVVAVVIVVKVAVIVIVIVLSLSSSSRWQS